MLAKAQSYASTVVPGCGKVPTCDDLHMLTPEWMAEDRMSKHWRAQDCSKYCSND